MGKVGAVFAPLEGSGKRGVKSGVVRVPGVCVTGVLHRGGGGFIVIIIIINNKK